MAVTGNNGGYTNYSSSAGDISISPEALDEKSDAIIEEFNKINVALQEIEESTGQLSRWQSVNKDKYESKLKEALPKMKEMSEAISSYGGVAKIASSRVRAAEDRISRVLDA